MSLERHIHSRNMSDYENITNDTSDLHSDDNDDDDDKMQWCPRLRSSEDSSSCDLVWNMMTMVFCIPLCYPCYLTKKAR